MIVTVYMFRVAKLIAIVCVIKVFLLVIMFSISGFTDGSQLARSLLS